MPKISAVTFAYNEADNIRECLANIAPHVDELIIVDVESTDKTPEIAYEFTKNVHIKPYLICGDAYKEFLCYAAKGDWLLWFYPDERFSEKFLTEMHKLAESDSYDAYAVMRHEYRDGAKLEWFATTQDPNYQNRLHRKGQGIFYTELVHAELHGRYRSCYLPPEYYMEHRKLVADQEFDNFRLYVEYKHLLWKYRNTKVEPFKMYCDSYKQIIHDSEAKNATGERGTHPAEERWWEWWELQSKGRITLQEWMIEREKRWKEEYQHA